ncbi:MAG TPA: TIGR03435 family protein [Bryobacteraceae bacterium]|nr:TIGR03435 family protein [Bryobacteraceae bacterium]
MGTRYSVAELADVFARQLGRVIVDRTGLSGQFHFTIDLTPDDTHPSPLDEGVLLAALRDQLGLTVKSEKTPVDILTIDNAEKVVAGNNVPSAK